MRSADFTQNIISVVIDEAHCVSSWGESFRKLFGELGKLRSFIPMSVPFLATSATLPPAILLDVQLKLLFSMQDTFMINLGNDRSNITPIVCRMHGAAKDLGALDFLLDEALAGNEIPLSVVFFNTRVLTQKGCIHIKEHLPENLRHQVGFIHAGRSARAKRKVMQDFRAGIIRILCASEAAAMVCITIYDLLC